MYTIKSLSGYYFKQKEKLVESTWNTSLAEATKFDTVTECVKQYLLFVQAYNDLYALLPDINIKIVEIIATTKYSIKEI